MYCIVLYSPPRIILIIIMYQIASTLSLYQTQGINIQSKLDMSEANFIADTKFQEILRTEGISLEQYRGQAPATRLFPNAKTFPEFFNENLVSPYRIIKEFINDPHANIRALYFQLLRLAYEVEPNNPDYRGFIVNLRRMVFAPDFDIMFTAETENQREVFSDFQFKKFFAEFLVIMEKNTLLVEEIINRYPIIDLVFIHIFRSLLAARNVNEPFELRIQTEIVFGEFAEPLGLNVTSYGNCWKFEDSDMFCFEEDQNRLYLAYIVEGGEVHLPTETFASVTITETSTVPITTTTYEVSGSSYGNYTEPIAYTTTTAYQPLVQTELTGIDVVKTSLDPVSNYTYTEEVSYTPSSYTTNYTPVTTYETTTYASPVVTTYETTTLTSPYTSPVTTYESTSTSNPITGGTYTTQTYTSSYTSPSYTSPVTTYETTTYSTNYGDSASNDLVNKYLSGNTEKFDYSYTPVATTSYTTTSSYDKYGSSSYTSPVTSTKVITEEKVTSPGVEYISYTPVSTPIEVVSGATTTYGGANNYGATTTTTTSYGLPAATTYGTTSYSYGAPVGTTSYGSSSYQPGSYTSSNYSSSSSTYPHETIKAPTIGGGYLNSANIGTSGYSYQPAATTTSYTSSSNYGISPSTTYGAVGGSSSSYSNYGATSSETGAIDSNFSSIDQYKNDFSSPDILNIMRKGGSNSNSITGVNTVSATSSGGLSSIFTTGPVTTTTPNGTSTYEYSSSYSVEPTGAGYTQSSSSSLYAVSSSAGQYNY